MGNERIIVCDAVKFLTMKIDNCYDLMLTDIPYQKVNKQFGEKFRKHHFREFDKGDANTLTFDINEFLQQVIRTTRGNGVIFCGKEQFSHIFQTLDESGLTCRMLIWEKTNPSPANGQYMFLSGVECAVYFRKPKATFNGHCLNTVFRSPKGNSDLHPTAKCVSLFERLVEILTNAGDLVCDPCVGSGTTAMAAGKLNRRFEGCDINPKYVELAKYRYALTTPSLID